MARSGGRRRLAFGLGAALLLNAALIALLAPSGRDIRWPTPTNTDVAMRLDLAREAPQRLEREPATTAVGQSSPQASAKTAKTHLAPAGYAAPAPPAPQAAPSVLPSPPADQNAKAAGVQGAGDADLRARTALALRKLGACSRLNSGIGDAQDKALCTRDFAAADGATIEAIPIGKRADYDAAHAKAGYLVPADAADPNFVTSQFKRGGTVWTIHAGCGLVHGKWSCGVH